MTDLLTQLQNATEGSRELDALVFVEISRPDCTAEAYVRFPNRYDYEDGARPGDYWLVQRSGKQLKAAPHYTTNLQDAVSLVQKGREWAAGEGRSPDGQWIRFATVSNPREIGHTRDGKAATVPLALCVAIIKAHQSKAERAA